MQPTDVIPGPTPPNWYPDPQDPSALRWWDGATWTEHRAPAWTPPSAGDAVPNDDVRWILPLNTDGWAIAAGYLGLISLFPNPITTIPAIVCGIIGLRRISQSGKRGRGRAIFGIVVGTLWLGFFLLAITLSGTDA